MAQLSRLTLCRPTPITITALAFGVRLDTEGARELRSRLLRRQGVLVALPHAPRPLSCEPPAPRIPPPSPHQRRSVPAPWPPPRSSQTRRKGRRPDPPPPCKPTRRVAVGAAVSGWGEGRVSFPSSARRGCARRRRSGLLGPCCLRDRIRRCGAPLCPCSPTAGFRGRGPTQAGTTPRLAFRAAIWADGEVDLSVEL